MLTDSGFRCSTTNPKGSISLAWNTKPHSINNLGLEAPSAPFSNSRLNQVEFLPALRVLRQSGPSQRGKGEVNVYKLTSHWKWSTAVFLTLVWYLRILAELYGMYWGANQMLSWLHLFVEMASTLLHGLTWNSLCSLGWLWTHGSLSTPPPECHGYRPFTLRATEGNVIFGWVFPHCLAVYLEMLCRFWQHLQLQSLPKAVSWKTLAQHLLILS